MSTARQAIEQAIRNGLQDARAERERLDFDARRAAQPEGPVPGAPTDLVSQTQRVDRFHEGLERIGGYVTRVRDEDEGEAALRALVDKLTARSVAHSDDPLAQRWVTSLSGVEALPPGVERERLLASDLGVTSAQWGIAETGTLILCSAVEQHRLASLVPPVHLAILRTSRILGDLGQALRAVHKETEGGLSPAVTFVTGPSRTADIELTLVVGVHGPKELHVLLLEDETT